MNHAWIADAVRTPRGKGNDKGSLKSVKPAVLLAQTLRALAHRTGLDTGLVNDAIFGCVSQTGDQGTSVGTLALPLAGWSDSVSAVTLNRYCASGLSATNFAALQALHGDTLAVGGGIEMMSRVPMGSDQGPLTHDLELQTLAALVPIGIAADAIATQRGYTREMLDAQIGDHAKSVRVIEPDGEVKARTLGRVRAGETSLHGDDGFAHGQRLSLRRRSCIKFHAPTRAAPCVEPVSWLSGL